MPNRVYIYALRDPKNQSIWFIGKTTQTLRTCLKKHMRDCWLPNNRQQPVSRWLIGLDDHGKEPIIEILHETTKDLADWQLDWERKIHSREISDNICILNGGVPPKRMTKEELKASLLESIEKEKKKPPRTMTELSQDIIDQLGKVSDAKLAKLAGVTEHVIRYRRQKSGIASQDKRGGRRLNEAQTKGT